jgi:hypothetical protein
MVHFPRFINVPTVWASCNVVQTFCPNSFQDGCSFFRTLILRSAARQGPRLSIVSTFCVLALQDCKMTAKAFDQCVRPLQHHIFA